MRGEKTMLINTTFLSPSVFRNLQEKKTNPKVPWNLFFLGILVFLYFILAGRLIHSKRLIMFTFIPHFFSSPTSILKHDFLKLQSECIDLNMCELRASTIHVNPDFLQEKVFLPVQLVFPLLSNKRNNSIFFHILTFSSTFLAQK